MFYGKTFLTLKKAVQNCNGFLIKKWTSKSQENTQLKSHSLHKWDKGHMNTIDISKGF